MSKDLSIQTEGYEDDFDGDEDVFDGEDIGDDEDPDDGEDLDDEDSDADDVVETASVSVAAALSPDVQEFLDEILPQCLPNDRALVKFLMRRFGDGLVLFEEVLKKFSPITTGEIAQFAARMRALAFEKDWRKDFVRDPNGKKIGFREKDYEKRSKVKSKLKSKVIKPVGTGRIGKIGAGGKVDSLWTDVDVKSVESLINARCSKIKNKEAAGIVRSILTCLAEAKGKFIKLDVLATTVGVEKSVLVEILKGLISDGSFDAKSKSPFYLKPDLIHDGCSFKKRIVLEDGLFETQFSLSPAFVEDVKVANATVPISAKDSEDLGEWLGDYSKEMRIILEVVAVAGVPIPVDELKVLVGRHCKAYGIKHFDKVRLDELIVELDDLSSPMMNYAFADRKFVVVKTEEKVEVKVKGKIENREPIVRYSIRKKVSSWESPASRVVKGLLQMQGSRIRPAERDAARVNGMSAATREQVLAKLDELQKEGTI